MDQSTEKGMLTREIHRLERMVVVMKKTNKLVNLETALRELRGRYQEIEKFQTEQKPLDKITSTSK